MNAPRSPCVCPSFARSSAPPLVRARHGRALPRFVSPRHTAPPADRFYLAASSLYRLLSLSMAPPTSLVCRARFHASTRLRFDRRAAPRASSNYSKSRTNHVDDQQPAFPFRFQAFPPIDLRREFLSAG